MLLDEQGSDQAMAKVEDEEPNDDEPALEAEAGHGGGGKRKLLLIAAGSLVLILGAGSGAYFSGFLDRFLGSNEANTESQDVSATPTFYALPEILVSLNTSERRSTFLKVKMSLELSSVEDQPRVELLLPRIIDYCHVYMRELRLDEVRGSAGSARLREELLRRIAAAVAPVPVRDVLFNELFIQ